MKRLKNIFLASIVLGGLTASTTTLPRAIGITTLISSPRNFYFIPRPSKKLNLELFQIQTELIQLHMNVKFQSLKF